MIKKRKLKWIGGFALSCLGCLVSTSFQTEVEASKLGVSYLGTFEGNTTFMTSSSNGINPGLFIEVMDDDGNRTQYESEEGVITIPNTKEGAYVTQAKLLGKTQYRDQDTNELLDTWEEGRTLKLESVENPKLITSASRNMWSEIDDIGGMYEGYRRLSRVKFPVVEGEKIFISVTDTGDYCGVVTYDQNGEKISDLLGLIAPGKTEAIYTVEKGVKYISPAPHKRYLEKHLNIMYNRGEDFLPYEENLVGGAEENILTSEDDIVLRGFNDVKDELNLMTGELMQRIDDILLDGSEKWFSKWEDWNGNKHFFFSGNPQIKGFGIGKCDKFIVNKGNPVSSKIQKSVQKLDDWGSNYIVVTFPLNELETPNVEGFKKWLSQNHVDIQYVMSEPNDQKIDLKATHQFQLLSKSFVQVTGTIPSMVASITVPTEELTFTLDPNQEAGQQFIAPEFEVTNESNAPLTLTLKTFEQTTDVFNDVLPETYESWDDLTKEQSKDIALGLVAQPSDDWLDRIEKTHYVSETNNNLLGSIKPKGTVGFEFIAHHGQAFSEMLNPSYKLTFVFDLLQ